MVSLTPDLKFDVMVDLETMSTASNAAIISIGAVRFDLEEYLANTSAIDEKDCFYRVIPLSESVIYGLKTDARTIEWWMQQSDAARDIFTDKTVRDNLPNALSEFHDFIWYAGSFNYPPFVNIWGNGATFDNVILSNAFKACDLRTPWKYNADRDLRTLKDLAQRVQPRVRNTINEEGSIYHNALHDAKRQVLLAQRYWRMLSGRGLEIESDLISMGNLSSDNPEQRQTHQNPIPPSMG
jgi:exodeoxyribonuclease VIII